MAAAGFLSHYLNGLKPCVQCHIIVNKKCVESVVKSNISFLPSIAVTKHCVINFFMQPDCMFRVCSQLSNDSVHAK